MVKLRKDPAAREALAESLVAFLKKNGFSRDGALKAEDWRNITRYFEELVAKPSDIKQSVYLWAVLRPGGKPDKKREALLAAHDDLADLRSEEGKLRGSLDDGSRDWVKGFLAKAGGAARSILEGSELQPGDVAKDINKTPPVGAPEVGEGSRGGGLGAGEAALGANANDMYRSLVGGKFLEYTGPDGKTENETIMVTPDGRTLSVRFYADYVAKGGDDADAGGGAASSSKGGKGGKSAAKAPAPAPGEQGEWKYRIGIFDITNQTNVHGLYVPLSPDGTAKFTLGDAEGSSHDYSIAFKPRSRSKGERDWKDDTQIQIWTMKKDSGEVDDKVPPHMAWLNDLVYERAKSAKLFACGGSPCRTAVVDGHTYYVAPQGGMQGAYAFYNKADVDDMLAGQRSPRNAAPRHMAYISKAGSFGDVRNGESVHISQSKSELAYDEDGHRWLIRQKKNGGPPEPGAEADKPTEPDEPGAPPVLKGGSDRAFPPSGPGGLRQDPINAFLRSAGVPYRLYDAPGGRVAPMVLGPDGRLQPLSPLPGGRPAAMGGGAAGEVTHLGSMLVFIPKAGKAHSFFMVDEPFKKLGSADGTELLVLDERILEPALAWTHAGSAGPDAGKFRAAMNAKLAALGGDLAAVRGAREGDSYAYSLKTTATGDQFIPFFSDREGGAGASTGGAQAPPAGKASSSGYLVGGGGAAAAFPDSVKLGGATYAMRGAPSQAFAVYTDVSGACAVNWRIQDANGNPTDSYTGPTPVFFKGQKGENPCVSAGWVIRPVQVQSPAQARTLSFHWKDGQLGVYSQAPGANNKNDGLLGWVVSKP